MRILCITKTWRYQVAVQRKVSMKWKSSRMLKLMETSTVQCHRSHRCHCVNGWFFIMRSKSLLDMLLKECDFVSSFVVRSVASWTCSKLGAERRCCCLLHRSLRTIIAWLPIAVRTNWLLVCLRERLARQMPKSRPFIFTRFPQECMCLAVGEDRLKFVKCCSIQPLLTRYVLLAKPICFTKKPIVINNTIWLSLFAYKRKKTNQAPNAKKLAFHVFWFCIIII